MNTKTKSVFSFTCQAMNNRSHRCYSQSPCAANVRTYEGESNDNRKSLCAYKYKHSRFSSDSPSYMCIVARINRCPAQPVTNLTAVDTLSVPMCCRKCVCVCVLRCVQTSLKTSNSHSTLQPLLNRCAKLPSWAMTSSASDRSHSDDNRQ